MRAVLVLAALPVLFAGCSDGGDGGGRASYATYEVAIEGNRFVPASLALRQGDRVEWTNGDGVAHSARLESGERDTGPIGPGETKGFHLPSPGSLRYRCTFHPGMTATLVVAAD